ncbi:MAG: hypothetical protein AAFR18_22255 [Cyanobacteria bacterium J06627_32]
MLQRSCFCLLWATTGAICLSPAIAQTTSPSIATTTGSGNVGTTVTGSTSYTVIGGSDQGNILFHSFQDFSPQVEVRASNGRWQPRLSESPTPGSITFNQRALVSTSGTQPGSVQLWSGHLTMQEAALIWVENQGTQTAAPIELTSTHIWSDTRLISEGTENFELSPDEPQVSIEPALEASTVEATAWHRNSQDQIILSTSQIETNLDRTQPHCLNRANTYSQS